MKNLVSKQTQLEILISDYFSGRSDTIIHSKSKGAYVVELTSPSAQQDFGGKTELLLVFDPNLMVENYDGVLITPNHPFVDVIRNDLESRSEHDTRISEAFVVPSLINRDGRYFPPHLTFTGGQNNPFFRLRYLPSYIVTFFVNYEKDEPSESYVRVVVDGKSGQLLVGRNVDLSQLNLSSGRPQEAIVKEISMTEALSVAKKELENQIKIDIPTVKSELSDLLSDQIAGLQTQFSNEFSVLGDRDQVRKEQLQTRLQKDIEDLENKFSCKVNVRLTSILKLWWPIVRYKLEVRNQVVSFDITGISYDFQTNKTSFRQCPECGNNSDFSICASGAHVECANHTSVEICETCQDSFCEEHGSLCEQCDAPVCYRDRDGCQYGNHSADIYFCPNCHVNSFENKTVCHSCLEVCSSCSRNFAHEHMEQCRIGGESICLAHGSDPCGKTCEECGAATCAEHGLFTADQTWVCADHGESSSCCDKVFAKNRLGPCHIDQSELLCPDHRFECIDCQNFVCDTHSYNLHHHPNEKICSNCRLGCSACGNDRHYSQQDLEQCIVCKDAICADHRIYCTVCSSAVCEKDVHYTVDGEAVCSQHVATCAFCPLDNNWHKKQDLARGAVSQKPVCHTHRQVCQICEMQFIEKDFISQLPFCSGCKRHSCTQGDCKAEMYSCASCQMPYCQTLFSRKYLFGLFFIERV